MLAVSLLQPSIQTITNCFKKKKKETLSIKEVYFTFTYHLSIKDHNVILSNKRKTKTLGIRY